MSENGVSIGYGFKVWISVGESDEAASCVGVIDEASFEELRMSLLKLSQ